MAYQTGTGTGAANLLGTLSTFAAANGWTIDDAVGSNKFALHKGSIYISFRYDATVTGASQIVSVHQALGHTPGNIPGTHPNDSGSGYNATSAVTNSLLDNERYVDLGPGSTLLPFTYYFFEQDSGPAYLHVVVALADGRHRHFGFGEIDMFGTWTGGEYAYGHHVTSTSTGLEYATTNFCCLLDGRSSGSGDTTPGHHATLYIEGFPGEAGASKWGQINAVLNATTQNDTAGNARFRIQGGYRGGPLMNALGNFAVSRTSGFINLVPILLFAYVDQTSPTLDSVYYLGSMPDVRGIILDGIAAGEELDVGTDTWVCFPSSRKSVSAGTDNTLYQGVAYRKETA